MTLRVKITQQGHYIHIIQRIIEKENKIQTPWKTK